MSENNYGFYGNSEPIRELDPNSAENRRNRPRCQCPSCRHKENWSWLDPVPEKDLF